MLFVTRLISFKVVWNLTAAFVFLFVFSFASFTQPANNNCANASILNIASSGFGRGAFTNTQHGIKAASLQAGESFATALIARIRVSIAKNRFYIPINQCYGPN